LFLPSRSSSVPLVRIILQSDLHLTSGDFVSGHALCLLGNVELVFDENVGSAAGADNLGAK